MKKILLIEDNEEVRRNTAEILELSNYKVIEAENGKIGVEKALEHHPDLIVCDIMMPVLEGYGVLHALQKNDQLKQVPFIFLTAMTERSDLRRGMELGADDYITKPFTGTELLNAVEGRMKKMDLLKKNLLPKIQELDSLMKTTYSGDNLEKLIRDKNINRYKKKQIVYSEGNHPYRLYFVKRGKIRTYKTNDNGKELITELYSEEEFFGYIPMLEGGVYKDSAETIEESELITIPREDFDRLVYNDKEIAQKFLKLLARNISQKEELLVNIAYNSLRRKVADALMILYKKFILNKPKTDNIDISRGNLANIAGTAKESLIRTLSDFRKERLIDIQEDGNIMILEPKKLELMVN